MKKRFIALFVAILTAFTLSGCGSIYDKEYISVVDYSPPVPPVSVTHESITVKTLSELRQALLSFVSDGQITGCIIFDSTYEGDPAEDLSSACWQVRTQNALCAYCVENISYELEKIVTYYEASVLIKYTANSFPLGKIERLSYSFGADEIIKKALENGQTRLALLIGFSSYSAEDMELLVTKIYRENPLSVPKSPISNVIMFSGTNNQRLYEVSIDYGTSSEELAAYKRTVKSFDPIAQSKFDAENADSVSKAFFAYNYIEKNCELSVEDQDNTANSALIKGCANSEGAAFAFVELCHRLGLECRIVYGQKNWEDHCWNIVKIDDDYYHVDVSTAMSDGSDAVFLLRDEDIWGEYRWDVSTYPACVGELTYQNFDE